LLFRPSWLLRPLCQSPGWS